MSGSVRRSAELEGVSASRAHQLVARALVAEAAMRALGVHELDICPWALREGVILRRLDAELDGNSNGNGKPLATSVAARNVSPAATVTGFPERVPAW